MTGEKPQDIFIKRKPGDVREICRCYECNYYRHILGKGFRHPNCLAKCAGSYVEPYNTPGGEPSVAFDML